MTAFVLAAALVLSAPADAANRGVQASARLGVSGLSASEGWNYVIADLHNRGEAAACELSLPVSLDCEVVYSLRLAMPRQSRKRAFLYFRAGSPCIDTVFKVKARGQDKPVLEAPFCVRMTRHSRAVAVIGRPVGLNSHLLGLKADACRACAIPPADTPDLWLGYTLLDAVVLSNCDPTRMSPAQQTALVHWVKAGGHAIVAGGLAAGRLKGTPLHELCLGATTTRPLSDAGAIAAWAGPESSAPRHVFERLLCVDVEAGRGQPMVTAEGRPLVVRSPMGLGRVDFLCFDPSEGPFCTWRGRGRFWSKLLGMDFDGLTGAVLPADEVGALAGLLTAGTARPIVAYAATTLLVAAYALAIGPLAHFVLKRIRRQLLYAPAILCLIALSTALAWALSSWLHGAKHLVNVVSLVDVPETWDIMAGHSFAASYRSRPQPLSLTCLPGRSAAHPIPRGAIPYRRRVRGHEPTRMQIAARPDGFTIDVPKPRWRLYGWATRWLEPFPSDARAADGLRHALRLLGGGLSRCHVLTKDDIYFVGDVNAADLSLPLHEHVGGLTKGLDRSAVCDGVLPVALFREGMNQLRLLRLSFAKGSDYRDGRGYRAAIGDADSQLSLRSRLDAGQAYLFGWARECPFAVQCPEASPSLRSTILARIELPPGTFTAAVE